MNIQRIVNASIGATRDIKYVQLTPRAKLSGLDKRYYDTLVKHTGEPSRNIRKLVQNWKKAYAKNVEQLKMIEEVSAPFKRSFLSRMFSGLR